MALSNEAGSSAHGTPYFRGNIGVTSSSEEGEEALISGYEIPMSCNHNFRNLGMFKKTCLEGYYNWTPYLAFHGVGKVMFDRIDKYRDVHLQSMRMLYDEEFNLLIVNLRPSPLHGSAEGQLTLKIYDNLTAMGQGPRYALKSMGHTRYGNPGWRSKEPDVAFRLSTWAIDDWLSFVVEVGVSETLKLLRMDAWYWLTQSGGLTQVVLIVKVDESPRSILIEQWEDPLELAQCVQRHQLITQDRLKELSELRMEDVWGLLLLLALPTYLMYCQQVWRRVPCFSLLHTISINFMNPFGRFCIV